MSGPEVAKTPGGGAPGKEGKEPVANGHAGEGSDANPFAEYMWMENEEEYNRQDKLPRSPFTYKDEDVENARCCSLVEKPARVIMTRAGFRLPAGRLLSPPHPDKVSITVLKADRRNDVHSLEWDGVFFSRVVSSCYSAAEEQVKGWLRVSDYTEDGHMILSVLCYFPIVEVEREGREEPQKKRKREESADGSKQKRLRL
ncbi:uncharacterized protein AKAME5_002229800 [Lates japonicus]|uniref:Uncharacterized protein n=1 Tax=Lates japonicus TaxID=270547 RepID=A0AAD3NDD6_LATJO|nr:uncharacterized protein AKAME5_002229800 [Lates japonicus]